MANLQAGMSTLRARGWASIREVYLIPALYSRLLMIRNSSSLLNSSIGKTGAFEAECFRQAERSVARQSEQAIAERSDI